MLPIGVAARDCYSERVAPVRCACTSERLRVPYLLSRRAFGWLLPLLVCGCVLSTGCRRSAAPATAPEQPNPRLLARQEAQALVKSEGTARAELADIPTPSKHKYVNVHSTDAWENPLLTVHRDSMTLRVIFPRQTNSPVDAGTMLHPEAARRQELELRMSDLPEGLAAVPEFAWPYGRVVAIQESPTVSRQDRVQVRRNVEQAIRIVNDLDVVVDEWNAPAGNGLPH